MKEKLEEELRNNLHLVQNYVGVLIILSVVLWVTLFSFLLAYEHYTFAIVTLVTAGGILHHIITTLHRELT